MLFAAFSAVRSISGRYNVHIFAIAITRITTNTKITILNMIANEFKIFSFRQSDIAIFMHVNPQIDNAKNKKIPIVVFIAEKIIATRTVTAVSALLTATADNIS